MKGLEPPRISPPDPKSGAATNYATPAFVHLKGLEPPRISPPDLESGAATDYATDAYTEIQDSLRYSVSGLHIPFNHYNIWSY